MKNMKKRWIQEPDYRRYQRYQPHSIVIIDLWSITDLAIEPQCALHFVDIQSEWNALAGQHWSLSSFKGMVAVTRLAPAGDQSVQRHNRITTMITNLNHTITNESSLQLHIPS